MTGPGKGIVTVSDGKGNSIIIPDHGGGVAVTSSRPGSITINNGAETRTLYGSYKLTISGARTVSVDKGIQVGPPLRPTAARSLLRPVGTVTGGNPASGTHA